ncbi:MAG: S8 family serine peptidase [Planctomycetes bacterium]|nr:S8 family serine peptidase [Planctomycetota bacterium]
MSTPGAAQAPVVGNGVAGSLPGTQRWIIFLKDRGYSLNQALQAIRNETTVAGRRARLATLRQLASTDQSVIAQTVVGLGGVVDRNLWMANAISVHLPRARLAQIAMDPRVRRLEPVRAYPLGDVDAPTAFLGSVPMPIGTSTNQHNHNKAAAWTILGEGQGDYKGAGARIAVFDSGIDADVDGATPTVVDDHPEFLSTGGVTRIEAFLQGQDVNMTTRHADVNILQTSAPSPYVGLTPPHGFRQSSHHTVAGHGTAMAAIAAGSTDGHAPEAALIDVAITSYPFLGGSALFRWETLDVGYLGGIERLTEFILENKPEQQATAYVHVITISSGGPPSPDSEVAKALDSLARWEDILIIANAGNEADTTQASHGFYHGVAVGAVHARAPGAGATTNFSFLPMFWSSRGPLFGDPARLYPDLCATGAGPGSITNGPVGAARRFVYPGDFFNVEARGSCLLMPGIDVGDLQSQTPANNTSPVRYNFGTSEAAAQVAGAAALYRGKRSSLPNYATAEETRAALLLNVLGTFATKSGTSADPAGQHWFTNRNTYGVGYVRDDLLAEFAVRDAGIVPLAEVVTLSETTTETTVSYGPLAAGERYGVVACWRRYFDVESDQVPPPELELPNVDLVVEYNGNVIARSQSTANSYERAVFEAPAGSSGNSATLRVRLASTPRPEQGVVVQIVARKFAADIDPDTTEDPVLASTGELAELPAGAGCTMQAEEWTVARVVPEAYANADAWGSAPFQVSWNPTGTWYQHRGYSRGFDLTPSGGNGATYKWVRFYYASTEVGGAMTIDGLAFRSSTPLDAPSDIPVDIHIALGNFPANQNPLSSYVTQGTLTRIPDSAGDLRRDHFPVQLRFANPFSYPGGSPLNIWIVAPTSQIGSKFEVDGMDDGGGGYLSYRPVDNSGQLTYLTQPGVAPMLGLLQKSSPGPRVATIAVSGEPWSGNGAVDCELMWRLDAASNTAYVMSLGFVAASPQLVGSCNYWLQPGSEATLAIATTDSAGTAVGYLTIPPAWVNSELGLQAVFAPSLFSNAMRLTIGGGL